MNNSFYKFKKCMYVFIAFASIIVLPVSAIAQSAGGGYLMTETEKEAVKNVVKEYIRDNADYVLEVLQAATQKQVKEEVAKNSMIETPPEGLYDSDGSPMVGNPDGDVTVVEFFDYNCGYCKRVVSDIKRLIEEDPNVKVVFKELPILSDDSQVAARYALAAKKQGKYFDLHVALMKHNGKINEKEVLRTADSLGIDIKQLNEDVFSTEVGDELTRNSKMARELGIRGTPFFIVGGEKLPGAVGFNRLRALVNGARHKAKSKDSSATMSK